MWQLHFPQNKGKQEQAMDRYAQKLKIEGSLRDNFLWPHIQA